MNEYLIDKQKLVANNYLQATLYAYFDPFNIIEGNSFSSKS